MGFETWTTTTKLPSTCFPKSLSGCHINYSFVALNIFYHWIGMQHWASVITITPPRFPDVTTRSVHKHSPYPSISPYYSNLHILPTYYIWQDVVPIFTTAAPPECGSYILLANTAAVQHTPAAWPDGGGRMIVQRLLFWWIVVEPMGSNPGRGTPMTYKLILILSSPRQTHQQTHLTNKHTWIYSQICRMKFYTLCKGVSGSCLTQWLTKLTWTR